MSKPISYSISKIYKGKHFIWLGKNKLYFDSLKELEFFANLIEISIYKWP
jgi:hypothetical protein